jgi:peptidoglycan hydrolase CwlO-like protein
MSTEDKTKKTKLEGEEEVVEQVETIEDKLTKLEERVAELESKLADTEKEVEEKEEELSKLKKKVPTTTPIVAKVDEVDVTKMNRTERIAFQLSNLQKTRNKK